MSEKIYRVQMNSSGMPNFATAVEVADRPQGKWITDKHKNIWDMDVDCYRCSKRLVKGSEKPNNSKVSEKPTGSERSSE